MYIYIYFNTEINHITNILLHAGIKRTGMEKSNFHSNILGMYKSYWCRQTQPKIIVLSRHTIYISL